MACLLLPHILISHSNPFVLDGRHEEKGAVNNAMKRAVTPDQLCADKAIKRDLTVDADFRSADLRGASFVGARLWHTRFADADLRPLVLPGGQRQDVDFSTASMSPVALENCLAG